MKDSRIFHYCSGCEFIFLDPRFRLNKEEEKARYELHENSIEDEGYVQFLENFIAQGFEPFAGSGSSLRVLDYGSGPSPVLAELLKRRGYTVDTYDPFYKPKAELGLYDFIVSTEVFEHFYEPMDDITRVVSLMKSGAHLSIMTSFSPGLEQFEAWWYKNDPTHVSLYKPKTFEYIADKLGLELVQHNEKDIITLSKV